MDKLSFIWIFCDVKFSHSWRFVLFGIELNIVNIGSPFQIGIHFAQSISRFVPLQLFIFVIRVAEETFPCGSFVFVWARVWNIWLNLFV